MQGCIETERLLAARAAGLLGLQRHRRRLESLPKVLEGGLNPHTSEGTAQHCLQRDSPSRSLTKSSTPLGNWPEWLQSCRPEAVEQSRSCMVVPQANLQRRAGKQPKWG